MKKYEIKEDFQNLKFLHAIVNSIETYLIQDIDIEPFTKFSKDFSCSYWYSCYHLLRDGKLLVDGEIADLFVEDKINVLWFTLTDEKTFYIKCKDGNWFL